MNKLLWSCAALLTLFVAVSSLTCNTCDVSILGYCAGTTPVTCTGNQNRCYSGIAKFSADLLNVHARGCIAAAACTNQTGSILTLNYSITRTCCSTNLCNEAAPAQLPLSAGLCAALVAVWSQFYN
ncbi:sperm acrosome membrane-associated protein 4-like isoform X1 [Amphiprion ocellaris]|uniref:sperm acrosome membrane-associated protein 4-like isoform X1 n=1 Tax=Amphiprion ocellaris TaxID=80972 RepID=UPI0024118404|nr:sperm acrosome membrane-associated protein 4-like isoform X1 [Amphiprion ocellaris]